MTSRMFAMGKMIENALFINAFGLGGAGAIMTCKQVAELAGVTKVTARKYLNMLVESGQVKIVENQLRGAVSYQYHCKLDDE